LRLFRRASGMNVERDQKFESTSLQGRVQCELVIEVSNRRAEGALASLRLRR
jgi:hypothetical protein